MSMAPFKFFTKVYLENHNDLTGHAETEWCKKMLAITNILTFVMDVSPQSQDPVHVHLSHPTTEPRL